MKYRNVRKLKRFMGMLLAIVLVLAQALPTAAAGVADFVGQKSISSKAQPGKSLCIPQASKKDGEQILEWTLEDGAEYRWRFEKAAVGQEEYYKIINKNSGLVLSVKEDSVENNADLIQTVYTEGEKADLWSVEETEDGYYKVMNANSGLALTRNVRAGVFEVFMKQSTFEGTDDQLWLIRDLDTRSYSHTVYTPPENWKDYGNSRNSCVSPRAIQLKHQTGENAKYDGRILMTWEWGVIEDEETGKVFPIYEGTTDEDGEWTNWDYVGKVINTEHQDDTQMWGMECCPQLFELPQKLGSLEPGTLICIGDVTPDDLSKTSFEMYASTDAGRTWKYMSTLAAGGANVMGDDPVWEPFILYHDGKLICYYSDETDQKYGQKLVHKTTTDGINWSELVEDVAWEGTNMRPGMPVVDQLADGSGRFIMSFEPVGLPGMPCSYILSEPNDPETWDKEQPGTTVGGAGNPYCLTLDDGRVAMQCGGLNEILINTKADLTGEWIAYPCPVRGGYNRQLMQLDNGDLMVLSCDYPDQNRLNQVEIGVMRKGTFDAPADAQSLEHYKVTTIGGEGAEIYPSDPVIAKGNQQFFRIMPKRGFAVTDVKLDGVSQGVTSLLTLSNVTAEHELKVEYTETDEDYRMISSKVMEGRGLCLPGFSTADDSGIIEWSTENNNNYYWTLDEVIIDSESYYKVMNINSGKVLSVKDASVEAGADVVQKTYTDGAMESLWKVSVNGAGYSTFINAKSKLALTRGTPKANGDVFMVQETDVQRDDQQWNVEKVRLGEQHTILAKQPEGGTVTVSQDQAFAGTQITISAEVKEGYKMKSLKVNGVAIDGQKFVMPDRDVTVTAEIELIEPEKEVFSYISSKVNEKGLCLPMSDKSEGARILEWTRELTANFRWSVEEVKVEGKTYYKFTNDNSKKVISVKNGSKNEGADLVQTAWKDGAMESLWEIKTDKEGYISFTNANSQLVLTRGTPAANGDVFMVQQKDKGEDRQKWYLEPVELGEQHHVTIQKLENGTITPSAAKAHAGVQISLDVKGNSGYALKAGTIKVNGTVIDGTKFVMPDKDVTVTAEFEKLPEQEKYAIIVDEMQNGSVTADKKEAREGDMIILTVKPDEGYQLKSASLKANDVVVTGDSFIMPAKTVTVTAEFEKIPVEKKVEDIFEDVTVGAFYMEALQYVYDKEIMTGMDPAHFGPAVELKRSHFVTTLYRMEGEPDVSGMENHFSDVPEESFYTEAVLWANANNIVTGYEDGSFGPDDTLTRAQLAAMLYRYAKYKGYDVSKAADLSSYPDMDEVPEFAEKAMKWAVAAGIIKGMDNGDAPATLAPQGVTSRAQCAVILYRFLKMHEK